MGKKILHVVNISFVIPYYLGEQIDYFNSKGHSIIIACSPSEDFFEYSIKKSFTPLPLEIKRSFSIINDLIAIFKLTLYLKNNSVDTVVGHTPKGAFIALISASLAGISNRIYFRHGLMFETSKGIKRRALIFIEKFTAMLSTQVISVSSSVLEKSNKLKLSSPKKNKILHQGTCNGIDAISQFNPLKINPIRINSLKDQFGILEKNLVVGYTGRISKDKGVVELLQAWPSIIQVKPNAILLLVGPLDKRDRISSKWESYINNTSSIICTGLVTNTAPYYKLMDCFILPSYREGFPTVVLEASSMSVPVITTKSTGCIDSIVEGITGIFTEINPNSISNSVLLLLNNNSLKDKLSQNGRPFVLKNFNQKQIWEALEKLF
jgi:glycosyltransferase involved in cell wall biosynthesis